MRPVDQTPPTSRQVVTVVFSAVARQGDIGGLPTLTEAPSIRAPEVSTNMGFGDSDKKRLYIAAHGHLQDQAEHAGHLKGTHTAVATS